MADVLELKKEAFINAAQHYLAMVEAHGADSVQAQEAFRSMSYRVQDYREEKGKQDE